MAVNLSGSISRLCYEELLIAGASLVPRSMASLTSNRQSRRLGLNYILLVVVCGSGGSRVLAIIFFVAKTSVANEIASGFFGTF